MGALTGESAVAGVGIVADHAIMRWDKNVNYKIFVRNIFLTERQKCFET